MTKAKKSAHRWSWNPSFHDMCNKMSIICLVMILRKKPINKQISRNWLSYVQVLTPTARDKTAHTYATCNIWKYPSESGNITNSNPCKEMLSTWHFALEKLTQLKNVTRITVSLSCCYLYQKFELSLFVISEAIIP